MVKAPSAGEGRPASKADWQMIGKDDAPPKPWLSDGSERMTPLCDSLKPNRQGQWNIWNSQQVQVNESRAIFIRVSVRGGEVLVLLTIFGQSLSHRLVNSREHVCVDNVKDGRHIEQSLRHQGVPVFV